MEEANSHRPRFKLVVSDFHLGKGRYFEDGTQNIMEDFIYDREFAEFLNYYRSGGFAEAEVELILNGDILNLLQIDTWGVYTHLITESSVTRAVQRIVEGHPEFFRLSSDLLPHRIILFRILWETTTSECCGLVLGRYFRRQWDLK